MRSFPLLIFFLLFLFACTEKEKETKFTITGKVTGFPKGTKFYLHDLATDTSFDSVALKNGEFHFEGTIIDPPQQIWLQGKADEVSVYTFLLLGNDEVNINADREDFPQNVSITGSKTQDEFNYLQSLTKDYAIQRDSLVQIFMSLPPEKQQEAVPEIWGEIGKIDSITDDIKLKYIESHPDTYSSVIELGYLKNQLPKDTIRKIYENYTPEIKNSKYAKVIEVYLRENIAKVGDKFHDFEGVNQNGEPVKFSEIRGTYSLLDFTSANCGPCILAADELIEINNKYADSLTIVSFTQDTNKEVWLKSLERDKVTWSSVFDGEGRYSETSIKYGIVGIPTFFLINEEGIIIDQWFGYSEGNILSRLEKKLGKQEQDEKAL